MFRTIRIQNFRTFHLLRAEGLAKINLITGKNGTGKTAFLEALFLNAGATNTSLCLSLENFRGTLAFSALDDSVFRNLFHRFSVARPIEILAEWLGPSDKSTSRRTLSISPLTAMTPIAMQSASTEQIMGLQFSFRGRGAKLSAKIEWSDQAPAGLSPPPTTQLPTSLTSLPPTQQLSIGEAPPTQQTEEKLKRLVVENPQSAAPVNAIFVLARFYSIMGQLHQQLVDATKQKTMDKIVEVVRIVDDRVTGIVPLSEKGISEVYIDIGEPRLGPL